MREHFGGFAKMERVAVRREFRMGRVAAQLLDYSVRFLRRKGYQLINGQAQEGRERYWFFVGSRFGFIGSLAPSTQSPLRGVHGLHFLLFLLHFGRHIPQTRVEIFLRRIEAVAGGGDRFFQFIRGC